MERAAASCQAADLRRRQAAHLLKRLVAVEGRVRRDEQRGAALLRGCMSVALARASLVLPVPGGP